MPGNVWHRLLGSSIVDIGISSNNMKSLSLKCYMTFWDNSINSDTSNDRIFNNSWLCYWAGPYTSIITDFDLITKLRGVLRMCATGATSQQRSLVLRTPGPVPFETCINCSGVETSFYWNCHVSGHWVSNIPRYFYFASHSQSNQPTLHTGSSDEYRAAQGNSRLQTCAVSHPDWLHTGRFIHCHVVW